MEPKVETGRGLQVTLVLASESPRRRELALALNAPVQVIPPLAGETWPLPCESPEAFVQRQAVAKARSVAPLVREGAVIAADTAVVLDGSILGKPASREDAVRMLRRLRRRTHRVVTGVAAFDTRSGACLSSAESTDVTMRSYADAQVRVYTATEVPYDKAGAYAIQDDRFRPVRAFRGCYLNVVGLPLCRLIALLDRLGASVRVREDWTVPGECRCCPLRLDEWRPGHSAAPATAHDCTGSVGLLDVSSSSREGPEA